MGKTKVIEPVTRIEGHAKITIHLDDHGRVEDTKFHVVEFRAFEKFVEGRVLWEMPNITSRICGICPVSHHLASVKGCDALVGTSVPSGGKKLRELLHMGQVLQSHALSFFYLSSPELVLGFDAEPAERNVVGVLKEEPELAKRGVMMRSLGQRIIETLAGKRVHPDFAIPGGVNNNLDREDGRGLLDETEEVVDWIVETIALVNEIYAQLGNEIERFASFPSYYMGLVNEDGQLDLYDGIIRLADESGEIVEEFEVEDYKSVISERSQDWSYLKFPYYRKAGFENGMYRVGPLGRLNVIDGIGTEKAHEEWQKYKALGRDGILEGSLFYHYSRLIELLYSAERIIQLLKDEDVYTGKTSVPVKPRKKRGIGVLEAPRGTLIHDYRADGGGTITEANFIVATGHNNLAMNKSVRMIAEEFINPSAEGEIPEGTLNRMESAIRCYDPCLSCSTHALGKMPLRLELVSPTGEVISRTER